MYLVDTNVLSELRRRDLINPRVRSWFDETPYVDIFISSVTIFEVQYGALLRRHHDRMQGDLFLDWINHFILPTFDGRIIPYDTSTALRCAALHVPDRRPERDAMIAATALEHRLTVVTRNVADFESMGVPLLNPWAA